MSINSIAIDFVCEACGNNVIAMPLRDVYYSAGKPCCSKDCKRRCDEALRGVNVSDFIKVLDGDPNFERMTPKRGGDKAKAA